MAPARAGGVHYYETRPHTVTTADLANPYAVETRRLVAVQRPGPSTQMDPAPEYAMRPRQMLSRERLDSGSYLSAREARMER